MNFSPDPKRSIFPLSSITYLKISVFFYFFYIGLNTNLLNGHFQTLGFTGLQRACIFFTIPCMGILANLFWGYIGDKKQNFQALFMLLCGISCIAFTVCLVLNCFASYIALGICAGIFTLPLIPMLDAYVIEVCHEKKLHYGEFRQYGTLAFIGANVFTFILFMLFPGIKSHARYLLFLIPLCFICMMFSLHHVFPKYAVPQTLKVTESGQVRAFFNFFMSPGILVFFIIAFFHHTSIVGHYYYYSSHLKILGFSESFIALSWSIAPVGEWFLFKYSTRIFPRFSEKQVLGAAILAGLVRWQIQAYSHDAYLLLGIQTLHTLCFGAYYLAMIHFLMHTFPKSMRRTSQAVFAITTSSLGQISGSWVYGLAFEWGHSEQVFHVASYLSLAALIVLMLSLKIPTPQASSKNP